MHLSNLKKLILSIKNNYHEDLSELERDGLFFRFKMAFKYSWQVGQSVLKSSGIEAQSPKEVFRELGKWCWISNVENWFHYYELAYAFEYKQKMEFTKQDLKFVPEFLLDAEDLILSLERQS